MLDDLASARRTSAAVELARLAARMSAAVEIERAATSLDLDTLHVQVCRFESAAREVRRLFAADCLVLEHEVGELADSIARRLAEGATQVAAEQWPQVVAIAGSRRGRALDLALDDAVCSAVQGCFEPLRHEALRFGDDSWTSLADRFSRGVQARANELQAVASELFHVHLPGAAVPIVHEVRERFSYLFVHVESPGSSLVRALETVLPGNRARRRILQNAHRQLASELEKHAGRARWDLVQRLDVARRRFVAAMTEELEETETSILTAASLARSSLRASRDEHAARARIHLEVNTVIRAVNTLSPDGPSSGSSA